jgi:iron complex outermembrane recepter protein
MELKNSAIRNLFENNAVIDQETITNDAVQEIPPIDVRLTANYHFHNEKMHFTPESQFVGSQNHVSLAYYKKTTPGFVLLSSTFSYQVNETFDALAGLQKIFDKAYYEHLNRHIVGSTDPLYESG